MKLLVDQNLPAAIAERLTKAGHDVLHTAQIGLERASDPEVLATCRDQERVLITADKKLTKYLATQRRRDPSVVIVRQFASRDDVAEHLATTLEIVESTIVTRGSAVFSLAPDKPIRVELLPLGSPS